jgi:hypothetical protein
MIFNAGTAIYNKLIAGTVVAGSAIYADVAPQSTAYPYVVFSCSASEESHQDAVDLRSDMWLVKVVSNNPQTAGSVQNNIRSALNYQSLTVDANWTTLWVTAVNQFQFIEMVNNQKIYHAGGTYRVLLRGNASHSPY